MWEGRDPGTTGALAEGTKGQGSMAGDEGAKQHWEDWMWILLSRTNHHASSPCPPKLGSHGRDRAFWAMGPAVPQLVISET